MANTLKEKVFKDLNGFDEETKEKVYQEIERRIFDYSKLCSNIKTQKIDDIKFTLGETDG